MIEGAWIIDQLDLDGEVVPVRLVLVSCTFEQDVILLDCTLPGLHLKGFQLPALNVQRLLCEGSLHLRDGFRAISKVDLLGAKITGQLSCQGGRFLAKDVVLNCYAITVGADVFLRRVFETRGTINLIWAEIVGDLDLLDASLTKGFIAQVMRVGARFLWQPVKTDGIEVNLFDAHVGTLMDPPESWQPVKRLLLPSFRYDRIESEMDVAERLNWLAKHDNSVLRFTPQPHVQLANVLRRNGFAAEAARILIRREGKQRAADWERAMDNVGVSLKHELIAFAHQYRH